MLLTVKARNKYTNKIETLEMVNSIKKNSDGNWCIQFRNSQAIIEPENLIEVIVNN